MQTHLTTIKTRLGPTQILPDKYKDMLLDMETENITSQIPLEIANNLNLKRTKYTLRNLVDAEQMLLNEIMTNNVSRVTELFNVVQIILQYLITQPRNIPIAIQSIDILKSEIKTILPKLTESMAKIIVKQLTQIDDQLLLYKTPELKFPSLSGTPAALPPAPAPAPAPEATPAVSTIPPSSNASIIEPNAENTEIIDVESEDTLREVYGIINNSTNLSNIAKRRLTDLVDGKTLSDSDLEDFKKILDAHYEEIDKVVTYIYATTQDPNVIDIIYDFTDQFDFNDAYSSGMRTVKSDVSAQSEAEAEAEEDEASDMGAQIGNVLTNVAKRATSAAVNVVKSVVNRATDFGDTTANTTDESSAAYATSEGSPAVKEAVEPALPMTNDLVAQVIYDAIPSEYDNVFNKNHPSAYVLYDGVYFMMMNTHGSMRIKKTNRKLTQEILIKDILTTAFNGLLKDILFKENVTPEILDLLATEISKIKRWSDNAKDMVALLSKCANVLQYANIIFITTSRATVEYFKETKREDLLDSSTAVELMKDAPPPAVAASPAAEFRLTKYVPPPAVAASPAAEFRLTKYVPPPAVAASPAAAPASITGQGFRMKNHKKAKAMKDLEILMGSAFYNENKDLLEYLL
jgi:hypothetical protein